MTPKKELMIYIVSIVLLALTLLGVCVSSRIGSPLLATIWCGLMSYCFYLVLDKADKQKEAGK